MTGQKTLTNEEIQERIKAAFAPLRCETEIWDYEAKLKFRVFDRQEGRSQGCHIPHLKLCRSPKYLETVLEGFRFDLRAQGYEFD